MLPHVRHVSKYLPPQTCRIVHTFHACTFPRFAQRTTSLHMEPVKGTAGNGGRLGPLGLVQATGCHLVPIVVPIGPKVAQQGSQSTPKRPKKGALGVPGATVPDILGEVKNYSPPGIKYSRQLGTPSSQIEPTWVPFGANCGPNRSQSRSKGVPCKGEPTLH